MGVYIPNVSKAEDCGECDFLALCPYADGGAGMYSELIPPQIEGIYPDCKIEKLDLVRCGECKKCEKRTTFNGLPFLYCPKMKASVGSDQYCYWGERE